MDFSRPDTCDPKEDKIIENSGQYIDDLKGAVLDSELTKNARAEEMEVFIKRRVYDVIPKSKLPKDAKVVGVHWVDTNKGSEAEPRIRSRSVAQ